MFSLVVLYQLQVEHIQGSVMEHLAMDQDHQLVMDHDHPPPTEDEQQRMAELWAMEEVNAPRGWDDEEELDYTVLSQRQAEHPGVSPERKGSGEYLTEVYVQSLLTHTQISLGERLCRCKLCRCTK